MKTIFRAILAIYLTAAAFAAYVPPIGTPAPSWGALGNPIDLTTPTQPSGWVADVAGYYYVKSGGTNAGYGHPGDPRGDIPVPAPAGSKIYIEGVYDVNHTSWTVQCEGTEADPVWITSAIPETPCSITGKFNLHASNSYVIFDNLRWDGENSGMEIASGVDHLCFRNGTVLGSGSEVATTPWASGGFIFYDSAAYGQTEQIIFSNMNISHTGNWLFESGDPDQHSIRVGLYHQDIWVVDCEISYTSGCAFQCVSIPSYSPDTAVGRRMYIGRNHAHHTAQTALWVKRSSDCVFSQNVVHDIRRDCPSSPNSGGIGCQYGPRNLLIIGNIIHTCQSGVSIASGEFTEGSNPNPISVVGNLIYNIHDTIGDTKPWTDTSRNGGVAIYEWSGVGTNINNNTIDDVDAFVYGRYSSFKNISGNIFTNRNTGVDSYDFNLETDTGGQNTIAYNIFAPSTVKIINGGSTYTTLAALNSDKSATNLATMPTYHSAATRKYDLLVGSAGIDALGATANAVYDEFLSLYGRSIQFDLTGGARPYNTNWDIGAIEFPHMVPVLIPVPTFSPTNHITFPAP